MLSWDITQWLGNFSEFNCYMHMKDLLKIIAYTSVYGTNIYGVNHVGLDVGKNNLESYFVSKLGWSKNRLSKSVKKLLEVGIFTRVKADKGSTCFKSCGSNYARLFLLTL